MADRKLSYELSLSVNTQAATAAVNQTIGATDGLARSANNVAAAAGRVNTAFAGISTERIKMAATMVGMAAIDLTGSVMRLNGMEREGGIATGAAQGALGFGSAGAMMGGPWGAAAGAVIGGVLGGAKAYLGGVEQDQKKLEEEKKLINEISVNSKIAVNAIAGLKTPAELESSLAKVAEQIYAIQQRAKYGLIEGWVADQQISGLRNVASAAEAALPEARARSAAEEALKDAPAMQTRQTDSLTAMGAILGGGLNSATNDYARQTSSNTGRMVDLLGRLLAKPATGGATWQQ
jgi:hypothetical protein